MRLALFVCLLLSSCAPRAARLGETVNSQPGEPPYRYVRVGEVYYLQAIGQAAVEAAVRRICKTPCSLQPAGELWIVEVYP